VTAGGWQAHTAANKPTAVWRTTVTTLVRRQLGIDIA
jgi:hypothetical protein